MIRVGYACMNLTLDLTTNHTTRLAFVGDVEKVQGIVSRNLSNIEPILRWNAEKGFHLFRLGQQLVPFASHPDLPYDWRAFHGPRMRAIGHLARDLGQRLSMHPGQFITPGSPDPEIVRRSLAEIEYAVDVVDLMGDDDSVVVLHVGGVYGDRETTGDRFVDVMSQHPRLLARLALENDERLWTPGQVFPIAERLGVPMILDTLHHRINPGDLSLREAFERSMATWRAAGKRPKMHISSQDPNKNVGAHAGTISDADWRELVDLVGDHDVDVMLEAKTKEGALPLGVVRRLSPPARAA